MEQAQSDNLLFAAVKEGDEHAFEILFKLHYPTLCNASFSIVKDEMVAEELVSDFLLRVWTDAQKLTIQSSVKGYFLIAVRNLSLNHLHGKKQQVLPLEQEEFSFESHEQSPLDVLITEEISYEWEEKIKKLPAQRQKVFRMNKLEGKPLPEIAKELSLSEFTVRNHISSAVRSLAAMAKMVLATIYTFL